MFSEATRTDEAGSGMIHSAPKSKRVVDEGFRNYIRALPCLLWDREPCECFGYLRVANKRYATECAHVKVRRHGDDANCVPLCMRHHREHDQDLGPKSWEAKYKLDLKAIARGLWADYKRAVPQADGCGE